MVWIRRLVETEVAERVKVSGIVSLGPSFGADGNLITSETYLDYSGNPKGSIEIGLVRLKKVWYWKSCSLFKFKFAQWR